MATYLTGRYIQFDIYPLCFDEYLYFAKTINRLETKKELFLEYIEFG